VLTARPRICTHWASLTRATRTRCGRTASTAPRCPRPCARSAARTWRSSPSGTPSSPTTVRACVCGVWPLDSRGGADMCERCPSLPPYYERTEGC
jgi:hypothetical protein